jgi:hypothetical protein
MYKWLGLFLISTGILSCSHSRLLLKPEAKPDSIRIHLQTNTIQTYEYRELLIQKTVHFIEVYNQETHPFKLALVDDPNTADCKLEFMRDKFVDRKKNIWATVISTAGIATATTLIATNFFLPVGWLYIPNAKTTLKASIREELTDIKTFSDITISTSGMYRKKEKQIDLQSTKVLKYMIEMIMQIESEYKTNPKP